MIYDDNVMRPDFVNGWGGGPAPAAIYDSLAWGSSDQLLDGCVSLWLSFKHSNGARYTNPRITVSGATFVAAAPSSFSQGEIHSDFGTGHQLPR